MLDSFFNLNSIINSEENKNTIIIFGIDSCSYCKNSIELLKKYNMPFKYINIEKYYKNFFNEIKEISKNLKDSEKIQNYKSVPMIFFNSRFIGGYTDLSSLF